MQRIATGFGLIEGPVWDPGRGLYFSDVINGGVHLLDRAGTVSPVIAKRRGIGGMALHASDGLVVGGRDIAVVRLADGNTHQLLSLDAIPGATGPPSRPPSRRRRGPGAHERRNGKGVGRPGKNQDRWSA